MAMAMTMLYAMSGHYISPIYVHFGNLSIFLCLCHIDDVSSEVVDEHSIRRSVIIFAFEHKMHVNLFGIEEAYQVKICLHQFIKVCH